ncbi:PRTRC system protein B [Sphingobacterium oryzagri]|uniref:PRTRC system protein B n=1 Tax=Sphingobacterium oryzagri TaxID=3025669 RepID=A0ABY7WDF2_9SPHI|nr:PRTRC system protein B [Sphingobacterium sp. KACC 22765]WDF66900.1 PRTRC system protein B [Sphingobacterium sp. KACC 22765]
MKDITHQIGTLYRPKAGLLIYQNSKTNNDTYVEYFDMDAQGRPVNAHPLTVREADRLAKSLSSQADSKPDYLSANGLLPSNVLHLDAMKKQVLWYNKPQRRELFFAPALGINSGEANIPALLWKADAQSLRVFALTSGKRPMEKTTLFHAPFFNIYQDGKVCMGTVDIDLNEELSLEHFMQTWESYFFESYFSHLIGGHDPINGNCVLLWESLVDTDSPFPIKALKKTNLSIKTLLP